MVTEAGMRVVAVSESDDMPYSTHDFVRERYNLNGEQVDELNMIMGQKPVYSKSAITCAVRD
jgi:hypothetical protein